MLRALRQEGVGLALLAGALLFGAVFLAPELALQRVALNDDVFHLVAAERLLDAFRRGEPFLDPWVSEWALGYPVWRTYQPLPHVLTALVLGATDSFVDHTTAFAWLQYLLLTLWPASVYAGARALGFRPLAAGLAALMVLAPSNGGDFSRYGIAYGAFVWRGSGLFTQIVALHALVITLGVVSRSLDTGRHRAWAATALACTGLCHIVFGYVAGVSALVLALTSPAERRGQRMAQVLTIGGLALLLVTWFVVPLFQLSALINHSRWEATFKWDSFGAKMILNEIVSGNLFDAGRPPLLSGLISVGLVSALFCVREQLPRRLLVLTGTWLLMFFGPATWGELLRLFGVPSDLHVHRLQSAFELSALLLGAWGVHRVFEVLRSPKLRVVLGLALAAAMFWIGRDRVAYLEQNASWGRDSLKAYAAAEPNLRAVIADVRALLAKTPGRVSAGLSNSWGRTFTIGSTPFYAFMSKAHFDHSDFAYHSMSLPSDVMSLRDNARPGQIDAFAVRALVAPAKLAVPSGFRRIATHGDFAVYEGSREGYFGLVDVTSVYTGPPSTRYEPSSKWLSSPLPEARQVVALESVPTLPAALPRVPRWTPLPRATTPGPCGSVATESRDGPHYFAEVVTTRDCHVLFKMSWDPLLAARVDGARVPLLDVTPGFGALPITAGKHRVEVSYEPGLLRPLLFVAGLCVFGLLVSLKRLQALLDAAELRLGTQLAKVGAQLESANWKVGAALAVLIAVALRPLFHGKLVDGHDATEYAPRLVELTRVLADGHFPPVWAPDLGAGYGQPLFEFAPPLAYLAALPFYCAGARLADSLQWGLALLHSVGAIATYLLARDLGSSRTAAVGVTAAWLFAPYTALDLYVRGAFAEASAVAVAPLAVLLLLRCLQRASVSSVVAAGAGTALVVLGHNGAALLFMPALVLLVIGLAATNRARVAGAASLALGLAFSAYFWMPALLEKGFVQTDLLREGFLHWSQHAVAWSQLLFSPWGYGLSGPGTNDGMSFALGLPQLSLALFGLGTMMRRPDHSRRIALTFGLVALAGMWLATASSSFVWERVNALQYLAYPWRALMLPGLFLPLLCHWAFKPLGQRVQLLAIAIVVLANVSHTEPKGYLTFDDEFYAPASIAQKGVRTTTREEYAPRAARVALPYAATKLSAPNGQIEVLSQKLESVRQEFRVRALTPTRAELATLAYPGWAATVDGRPTPLWTVRQRGTQSIAVPAGEHTIRLALHPTPVRRWSALLSLFAVLSAAGGIWFARARELRLAMQPMAAESVDAPGEQVRTAHSGIFAWGGERYSPVTADESAPRTRKTTRRLRGKSRRSR